jgi:hypothetical protein
MNAYDAPFEFSLGFPEIGTTEALLDPCLPIHPSLTFQLHPTNIPPNFTCSIKSFSSCTSKPQLSPESIEVKALS